MAVTTTTDISDIIEVAIAEARYTVQTNTFIHDIVTVKDISGTPAKSARFPKFGAITAAQVDEGTDYTGHQDLATSSVTLTVKEVVAGTIITDLAQSASREDIGIAAGRVLGSAIAKFMEKDLVALFTSFTTHAIGTTNVDLSVANWLRAKTLLADSGAPEPYTAVISPYVEEDLIQLLSGNTNQFGDRLTEEIVRTGYVGNPYGVLTFRSSNITEDTNGDATCAMFSKEAVGMVIKWDPKIEVQRDASLRGYEVIMTTAYNVGIVDETFGCKMLLDNAD
jgi:hypothetical protein